MIDPAGISLLYKHVRSTSRSLLQYAGESYPWTRDAAGAEALTRLGQLIQQEQKDTARIIRFPQRSRVQPPHVEPFPVQFTGMNFLALDRMLALLVEHQERDVAELEADLRMTRDAEVRKLLEELLADKKQHLDTLREMKDQHVAETAMT